MYSPSQTLRHSTATPVHSKPTCTNIAEFPAKPKLKSPADRLTLDRPMRLEEAAEHLSVSLKTVQRLVAGGKLAAFQISSMWFTKPSFIETYLNKQIQIAQKGNSSCSTL